MPVGNDVAAPVPGLFDGAEELDPIQASSHWKDASAVPKLHCHVMVGTLFGVLYAGKEEAMPL